MISCTNRDTKENCGKGSRFYIIPIKQDKHRLWQATMRRNDFNPPPDAVICSVHFIEGENNMKQLDLLFMK